MAALLLLLFVAGALFIPSNTQEAYDVLPKIFKEGVDLTLKKLNSKAEIQHHFLLFRGILRSDTEDADDVYYVFYHFYLKATNCSKGTVDSTACQFTNDGPLLDCAICYKTVRGEIARKPRPYVKCVDKTALTEKIKIRRENHCDRMDRSGAPGTLTSSMFSAPEMK